MFRISILPNVEEQAATKIQALWRGHHVRNVVKKVKEETSREYQSSDEEEGIFWPTASIYVSRH